MVGGLRWLGIVMLLVLAGCAHQLDADPQRAFWANLTSHCGKAYAGHLVSTEAADADMAGAPMLMHVNNCTADEIRIPFHVGPKAVGGVWDRSRTWVITRTATGLRLKHDHRHADGSVDKMTQYGGDTASKGQATGQDFAVDADSIAMFRREGRARSVTNVWTIEVSAQRSADATPRFVYMLRRSGENARYFRVEFDLSKPVDPPPKAWGW